VLLAGHDVSETHSAQRPVDESQSGRGALHCASLTQLPVLPPPLPPPLPHALEPGGSQTSFTQQPPHVEASQTFGGDPHPMTTAVSRRILMVREWL
jgi:hypothetical protein